MSEFEEIYEYKLVLSLLQGIIKDYEDYHKTVPDPEEILGEVENIAIKDKIAEKINANAQILMTIVRDLLVQLNVQKTELIGMQILIDAERNNIY
ncbi:MAG: hypothetical protein AABY22_28825 [Nanoarchaeota archaeon]